MVEVAVAVVTAAASAVVGFAAAVFAAEDFTVIGFTIVTSMTGFSSLTTLETRSFTIPIHTTDIIPTAIILMTIIRMAMVMVIILTAMDTVVFAAAAFV